MANVLLLIGNHCHFIFCQILDRLICANIEPFLQFLFKNSNLDGIILCPDCLLFQMHCQNAENIVEKMLNSGRFLRKLKRKVEGDVAPIEAKIEHRKFNESF